MAAAAVAQPPMAAVPNAPVNTTDSTEKAKKPAAKPAAKKPAAKPAAVPETKAPEEAKTPADSKPPPDAVSAAPKPEEPKAEAPKAEAPKPAAAKPAAKKPAAKPVEQADKPTVAGEKSAEPAKNEAASEPKENASKVTPPEKTADSQTTTPAVNSTAETKAPPAKAAPKKTPADKPKSDVAAPLPSSATRKSAETKARMDQLLSLWKDFQEAEKLHTQRIGDIEIRLKSAERSITRLSKFCGEYQLLWKIRDFRRVYEDATSEVRTAIQSPTFDTHRNGYKMQLSMCPNGDGKGKGLAMSVFFAIIKGPCDNILQWPFSCPVKITLIDQAAISASSSASENGIYQSRDVVRTFVPNPRPENEPFLGRPADQRNMSLGFPRFIQLTDLFSGGYIREDSLYIKVHVDIANVITNKVE